MGIDPLRIEEISLGVCISDLVSDPLRKTSMQS